VSYNEDEAALAEQVADLRAEGDELYEVLQSLDAADWSRTTTFKDWTVYDVLAHLHISDHLAITTLNSAEDLEALLHDVQSSDLPMAAYTRQWLGDVTGPELLDRWRNLFAEMSERLAAADPEQRLAWAGPPMKPRMFTTARQMETWAHGWEIYDLLGLTRKHSDRIYNIATIGVRTFGWTFANRQLPVSSEIPYIRLSAPSGAIWEWNDPGSSNRPGGHRRDCRTVDGDGSVLRRPARGPASNWKPGGSATRRRESNPTPTTLSSARVNLSTRGRRWSGCPP
jgi:uncharacterized protein (TIGR03084 family)